MSEKYLDVLLQVSGKNLDARIVNPLLGEYDSLLKELKVVEERANGKIFKASVNVIDDRKHELLDKNTLICSRKIKFNICNPYPHTMNNQEHYIYVLLHRAIMQLAVKRETHGEKIVIRTVDTNADGGFKKGRWPMTEADRAFL
jgi:hypothetical protein